MHFQSDWLEYYISKGIDILLWNYRGYGKSEGKPDLRLLIEDGKIVAKYIKDNFSTYKFGIHGESLGGCVAIHIAEVAEPDFLFADRTFGYLSDTVLFTFGRLAYFCFFVACFSDIDSVSPYLKLNCYKLLSSDPNDKLINDIASLKSALAFKLINQSHLSPGRCYLKNHLFLLGFPTKQDCEEICQSLKNVNDLYTSLNTESSLEKFKVIHTESNEEQDIKIISCRIISILTDLNAGGLSLKSIVKSNFPNLQFYMWLNILEIWGCYSSVTGCYSKCQIYHSVTELKIGLSQIKEIGSLAICKDIEKILKIVEKVCGNLKIKNKKRPGLENDEISVPLQNYRAGFLMPISCGHSGQYNNLEMEVLDKHLYNAKFALM